jgi:hypothetical protein
MSLGDNSELGGAVKGGGVRWLFFPDANVSAQGERLDQGIKGTRSRNQGNQRN